MHASRFSSPPRVAVFGASGAVGQVLLEVLAERSLPMASLAVLAGPNSAGKTVRFGGRDLPVLPLDWDGDRERLGSWDIAFFAATGELSRELAPLLVSRGTLVIDKSSTFRLDEGVPLVVPEINADALALPTPQAKAGRLVACPNCTTIALVMALEPLRRRAGLRSVVATSFQAVSGSGRPGVEALDREQSGGGWDQASSPFEAPIFGNVIPACDPIDLGEAGGATGEERKLLHETRKILSLPELSVSATCVRVPVQRGHGLAVLVETERPLSPAQAKEALRAFPGLRVVGDREPVFTMTPLAAAGSDEVVVARIRPDATGKNLWLWVVADNLRKGAATNAVQIAELWLGAG